MKQLGGSGKASSSSSSSAEKLKDVPSPQPSILSMDFVAVDAVISEFYICKYRIRRWVVNWMVSETRFIDLETFLIFYMKGRPRN